MRARFACAIVLGITAASMSQTAYDKCIEECLRGGASLSTCSGEDCDPSDTTRVVTQGQGNPLFLPSYELVGPAPVIDGSLMSRDGDPTTSDALDEWKSACSRTLILNDSGVVQLFLTNSPDTLYVGITYEHGNNSDGCGVRLYFDEGVTNPPSAFDGSTNMHLDAPGGICNEQGCSVVKAGGDGFVTDMCWNGNAWAADGDGNLDLRAERYFFSSDNKVHHNEFAIPLNANVDDATNSDLNVNLDDQIGFFLEVVKMGAGGGVWHWAETNGDVTEPDSFPFWANIQLSVKRNFFTFYTGRCIGASPVIDGSIQESAWDGAYQREMVLSNYHYGTYRCKVWCLEDSNQDEIFIGVRVYDRTHATDDYCQIFFEEVGENTTDLIRDFDLDDNTENSLKVTNGGQFTDIHWSMDDGLWITDTEAADAQSAQAGETAAYVDYEFRVVRSAGTNDIDIPQSGLLGFLVRYHDADKTVEDLSNYYWEYTTNNDAQLLDQQSHPYVYIATGWTNLQLGGPYIEVVNPPSSSPLSGTVPVEVSSGDDSLQSVVCFLSTDTTNKVSLTYQGSGTWSGSLNVTGATDETTMLVIRAVSSDGATYDRVVNEVDDSPVLPRRGWKSLYDDIIHARMHSAKRVDFQIQVGKAGPFSLRVYGPDGRCVWTHVKENASAGKHRVVWKAGHGIAAGTYVVVLGDSSRRIARQFSVNR